MKKFYRRSISGLLALLICFTTILEQRRDRLCRIVLRGNR